MDTKKYYLISLSTQGAASEIPDEIQGIAFDKFHCQGVEEYTFDEAQIDEVLGERAFCGGDLDQNLATELEEHKLGHQLKFYFYGDEARDQAFKFHNYLEEKLPNLKSTFHEEVEQDWNEEWKKHYQAIPITDNFAIVPSWEKPEPAKKGELYIYPGQGFGTGNHETTFSCLDFLCDIAKEHKVETCLDFGCGSGILGLGVLHFFPQAVVDFYDIDKEALDNCLQNIDLNLNFCTRSQLRLLDTSMREKLSDKYQLVFANVILNVLEPEREFLIEKTTPGGFLILSGILNNQCSEVLDLYLADKDMSMVEVKKKGDWTTILLEKNS